MPKCVCGKPLDKLPNWLEGVNVQFRCNNCPEGGPVPLNLTLAAFSEEDEEAKELTDIEEEDELEETDEIEDTTEVLEEEPLD